MSESDEFIFKWSFTTAGNAKNPMVYKIETMGRKSRKIQFVVYSLFYNVAVAFLQNTPRYDIIA